MIVVTLSNPPHAHMSELNDFKFYMHNLYQSRVLAQVLCFELFVIFTL